MTTEDPNVTRPPPEQSAFIPGFDELELIGRGGSADVYRGREQTFDRLVAIKVFVVRLETDQTREDFRRECTAVGRVSGQRHPNLVRVFGTGETSDGRPFLTMELMERSYADLLPPDGLPIEEVLRVGIALAGAIATAHRSGVLHRDIKPANVLISRQGDCALADFGVATVMSLTTTKSPLGLTLQHAAPEVLEGKPTTERSDVYSLGSTLHQLASGRPPFNSPGGEPFEAMRKTLEEQPPAIDRSDLPHGFEETLQRAMTRDPAIRTRSAAEFGQELQQVMRNACMDVPRLVIVDDSATSDEDEATEPPTPVGWPMALRRRPAFVAAALFLVVATVIAGVIAAAGHRSNEARTVEATPTTGSLPVTSEELVQLLDEEAIERLPGSIVFDTVCLSNKLNTLNQSTLRLMKVAGAGSRSSIDTMGGAIGACRLDPIAVADVMLAGGFGSEIEEVPPETRDCVAADLVSTRTAVRTVAVRALTSEEQSLVVDRYVADEVARSTARCLDPGELSRLVTGRLPLGGDELGLAGRCLSERIAIADPTEKAQMGIFLVDETQFPEPLQDAYREARISIGTSSLSC